MILVSIFFQTMLVRIHARQKHKKIATMSKNVSVIMIVPFRSGRWAELYKLAYATGKIGFFLFVNHISLWHEICAPKI
jgi:hypothetical protein